MSFETDARARPELTRKEGLIFYANGREDLTLQLSYHAAASGDEEVHPKRLAWVVPTPAVPDAFQQASAAAFTDANSLWPAPHPSGGGLGGGLGGFGGLGDGAARGGLQVLPAAVAGGYTIQPLRVNGAPGVQALQSWFEENGFAQLPPEPLNYYARNGWTFLAVRLNSSGALSADGTLPALRTTFPSSTITFPLKLARSSGPLFARFYLFTERPLSYPAAVASYGFRLDGRPRRVSRKDVPEVLGKLWDQSPLAQSPTAIAYRFTGNAVRPQSWTRELTLSPS